MLISTMLIYVFIDYKWGLGFAMFSLCFIAFLFFVEGSNFDTNNDFKKYVIEHNGSYYFITLFFVFMLMSAAMTVLTISLQKANQKIETLTKEKIDTLQGLVVYKTLELSNLRSNLSKDFHDEMGNKLASINIISETVGLKINDESLDKNEINQMLESIKTKSRELTEGTRDFIWSVDFKSDYVIEFYKYIRNFGNSFF